MMKIGHLPNGYSSEQDNDSEFARELIKSFEANVKLGLEVITVFEHILESRRTNDIIKEIPEEHIHNAIKALYGLTNASKKVLANGTNVVDIEERRQDDWDILNKKMTENEMFKESWEELLVLMRLEED